MRNAPNRRTASQWFGWTVIYGLAMAMTVLGGFPVSAQQASKLSNIDRRIEQREIVGPPPPAQPMQVPAIPPAEPHVWRTKPFVLGGIVIAGATVFEVDAFTATYEDFLARTVTAKDIETILQRITKIYRDAGYFLTRVLAPRQSVRAGVVRLQVIEGYVERVSVAGSYSGRAVIDRYARPVLDERPLRLETVERMLLLANDLPGVSVVPTLKPVDESGGRYEMVVNLAYKPVNVSIQFDNLGTPEVGRLQGLVSGSLNSPFSFGEQFRATFITVPDQPKELLYGSLEASIPIGANGARVSLFGALGVIDAGGAKADLDSKSEAEQITARLRYPVKRSRQETLWLTGSLDFRNFRENELGQLVTRDNLRVIRAGAEYRMRDMLRGRNRLSLELSQGLDILDASASGSATLSRSDGRSDFTKLAGKLARRQPLTDRIELKLSFLGQLAADPLLSYEEFSLGGEVIGRGYDFSELSGEHGIASSVELRYTEPSRWRWLDRYQFYWFLDAGAVWNDAPGSGYKRDTLTSTGFGVRLKASEFARASFEAAKPLSGAVATRGDDDWVGFFTVRLRY
jgi:hemolysin activation/secretion protein